MSSSCEIALRWIPQNTFDDKIRMASPDQNELTSVYIWIMMTQFKISSYSITKALQLPQLSKDYGHPAAHY